MELPAPRLGRETLQALVLLGNPLPAQAGHRGREGPQTSRAGDTGLLHTPDHQRRRGRPELADSSHPRLRPRLPQPRTLQDRDLLPLRRIAALPGHAMSPVTHAIPGRPELSGPSPPERLRGPDF